MDSFYDQPRKAPMLKSLSTPAERMLPNAVPDASMLIQNKGNIPQKKSEMSYNAWKYQLRGVPHATNKENTEPSKESLFRKHVRFETPQQNINMIQQKVPNFNVQPVRPSLVNKHIAHETQSRNIPHNTRCGNEFGMPRDEHKILQAKPFEKMYMANLPNRNLDLSIIEPPRQIQRSDSLPDGYNSSFLPNQHNNIHSPQSSHEYSKAREDPVQVRRAAAQSSTFEVKSTQKADNDELSVKDLLKIIQQQNEQLMCLQQQVSTLLKERSQQPQIEAAPGNTSNENWQHPVFKKKMLEATLNHKSPLANKFAIDVMTSFEVSIRGSNTNRFNNRRFPAGNNENYETARITEILDESSKSKPSDMSLKLDEPVVVDERCPSPENSIHVDMKDFSSEEEDEDETRRDEIDSSMIGWTIYNNVMDQVNFMLKKSTDAHNLSQSHQQTHDNAQFTGAIMKQVKEATLKHLKSVGISLTNVDDDLTVSSEGAYTSTQVSFAVKQLLMKYLPDEQLTKVVNGRSAQCKMPPPEEVRNGDYPKNLIKRRPDFSMATVQYMEKYNLLNRDNANNAPRQKQTKHYNFNKNGVPTLGDKMLDITALKQQPKLL